MNISLGVQQCLVCACEEALTKYRVKMSNVNKVLYVHRYLIKGHIVRRIKADRINVVPTDRIMSKHTTVM